MERGLNKLEGKPNGTSTASAAPDGGGVRDGSGAASGRDPNAPRSGDAVVGQEQPSGTEVQAEERGNRPADAGPTERM